jgi:hypothetical protein
MPMPIHIANESCTARRALTAELRARWAQFSIEVILAP